MHHGQLYPGPPAPGYLAPLPGFATVYNAPAEDSALHGDDWLLERANMIGKIEDLEKRRKKAVNELIILKKMNSNIFESEKLKTSKVEGHLEVERKLLQVAKSEVEIERRRRRRAEISESEEKSKRKKVELILQGEIRKRKRMEEFLRMKRLATAEDNKRCFLEREKEKEAKKLKGMEEEFCDVDLWSQFSQSMIVDMQGDTASKDPVVQGEKRKDALVEEGSSKGVRSEGKGRMSALVGEASSKGPRLEGESRKSALVEEGSFKGPRSEGEVRKKTLVEEGSFKGPRSEGEVRKKTLVEEGSFKGPRSGSVTSEDGAPQLVMLESRDNGIEV